MATYKKRGFKPKNKVEEQQFDERDSTTAEVFSTLDESASRSEEWVAKNQNYILGVIGVVAVAILGYLAYGQFIQGPKEVGASNELSSVRTGLMPRIWIDMPPARDRSASMRTLAEKPFKSVRSRTVGLSSSVVNAVMANGTDCDSSSRLRAVTVTFSIVALTFSGTAS